MIWSNPSDFELRAGHECGQRNEKAAAQYWIARLVICPSPGASFHHHHHAGRSVAWLSLTVAEPHGLRKNQTFRHRSPGKISRAEFRHARSGDVGRADSATGSLRDL